MIIGIINGSKHRQFSLAYMLQDILWNNYTIKSFEITATNVLKALLGIKINKEIKDSDIKHLTCYDANGEAEDLPNMYIATKEELIEEFTYIEKDGLNTFATEDKIEKLHNNEKVRLGLYDVTYFIPTVNKCIERLKKVLLDFNPNIFIYNMFKDYGKKKTISNIIRNEYCSKGNYYYDIPTYYGDKKTRIVQNSTFKFIDTNWIILGISSDYIVRQREIQAIKERGGVIIDLDEDIKYITINTVKKLIKNKQIDNE
jgi:hypothetical protein